MRYFAPAKINLMLRVVGKRTDGYHLLQSAMVFADVGDDITFRPASAYKLHIDGPYAQGLSAGDDNLITRAVRLMEERTGRVAAYEVQLTKNLPVASGLGGGSSNAACVMCALNALWGQALDTQALADASLMLGAELPICVRKASAWVEGVGERVRPLDVGTLDAVLVWPGRGVLTGDVFRVYGGAFSDEVACPDKVDMRWLEGMGNDLYAPACRVLPQIADVLPVLKARTGCTLARMSGSGSTCFGIFEGATDAQEAAHHIAQAHPEWWVRAVKLGSVSS